MSSLQKYFADLKSKAIKQAINNVKIQNKPISFKDALAFSSAVSSYTQSKLQITSLVYITKGQQSEVYEGKVANIEAYNPDCRDIYEASTKTDVNYSSKKYSLIGIGKENYESNINKKNNLNSINNITLTLVHLPYYTDNHCIKYEPYFIDDIKKDNKIIIKKLINDTSDNSYSLCNNLIREIDILRTLNGCKNIIRFFGTAKDDNDNVYMIFEKMSMDLLHYLRKNCLQTISEDKIKHIIYNLLLALSHCNDNKIMHRDVKLENVFVSNDLTIVKLGDFNLSRYVSEDLFNTGHLTTNVISLNNKPPEILLSSPYYNYSVDVWSIGCLIYKLLTSKPAFAGDTSIMVLKNILTKCCPEDTDYWPKDSALLECFFDNIEKTNTITDNLKCSLYCKDFLKWCFKWNIDQRPKAKDLLTHDWFV